MQFEMLEIFRKMSGFQWLIVGTLLAMAAASLTVVLDRLWAHARSRRASREFAGEAARLVAAGDYAALVAEAGRHKASHLARLLAAGASTFLAWNGRPSAVSSAELARREMARQRETLDAELRRGLGVLASTGSVAPFVGLLGTVVGIIAAFEGIAKEGSGGLGAVSTGISEALVVTALGLFVAIPTVLLFNYLSTRSEQIMLALDQAAGQLADHLEVGGGLISPEPTPHDTANGRAPEDESLATA